mmetsp:Transcript_33712/g.52719  ORF Transcript_33712/g.52719 Transcript_33712/m.52719 type:complete len:309 (-) Transcript_33712:32-958(-)
MPFILVPAFESMSGPFTMPKTKEQLENRVKNGKFQRFHRSFSGQALDLTLWFRSNEPFLNTPIQLANEHYGWFSRRHFEKVKQLPTLCHEQFTDRGFNKIMCYLHLRLLGFTPIFIPDGWVVHEWGLHDRVEQKEQYAIDDQGEILQNLEEEKTSSYLTKLGPHIFVMGICDLITWLGWWDAIESCKKVPCQREFEPKTQVDLKAIAGAKAKLQICYQDIVTIQGLGAFEGGCVNDNKNTKNTKPLKTLLNMGKEPKPVSLLSRTKNVQAEREFPSDKEEKKPHLGLTAQKNRALFRLHKKARERRDL